MILVFQLLTLQTLLLITMLICTTVPMLPLLLLWMLTMPNYNTDNNITQPHSDGTSNTTKEDDPPTFNINATMIDDPTPAPTTVVWINTTTVDSLPSLLPHCVDGSQKFRVGIFSMNGKHCILSGCLQSLEKLLASMTPITSQSSSWFHPKCRKYVCLMLPLPKSCSIV
jgi:hypothetical protein